MLDLFRYPVAIHVAKRPFQIAEALEATLYPPEGRLRPLAQVAQLSLLCFQEAVDMMDPCCQFPTLRRPLTLPGQGAAFETGHILRQDVLELLSCWRGLLLESWLSQGGLDETPDRIDLALQQVEIGHLGLRGLPMEVPRI